MTNKEQIIIDGIDVSECDHFREGYCHPGTGVCYKCDTNCQYAAFYLKEQLARKTQECEELKKTVLTKCPNCNSEYLTSKGIELYEENKRLHQECEELKERASNVENSYRKALYDIETQRNKIKELPNFDKNVFKEITGIEV